MLIAILTFLAGGLMLLGYLLYIQGSLRKEIEPNPTTWLMFSYGTVLLTVLELDRGAGWELSVVPITCSLLGVLVALICARRGKMRWPKDWEDRASFVTDITLTIGYVSAWYFLVAGYIHPDERDMWNLLFLILSNATTITAFTPILRATKSDPSHERSLPWFVWSLSYLSLGILTYLQNGLWTEFLIYPVMNTVLHLTVGILALPKRRERKLSEAASN